MLDALVASERDPSKLSVLALGTLRRKIPQLAMALEGQFTEHHAKLIHGAKAGTMAVEQYISADSYVLEPANLWVERTDKAFPDKVPRLVHNRPDCKGAPLDQSSQTAYPHQTRSTTD